MFLRWAEKELASREAVGLTWQEYAGAAVLSELNLWTLDAFVCVGGLYGLCAMNPQFQVPRGGSWIEISPERCADASVFAGHRKGELLVESEEGGGTA